MREWLVTVLRARGLRSVLKRTLLEAFHVGVEDATKVLPECAWAKGSKHAKVTHLKCKPNEFVVLLNVVKRCPMRDVVRSMLSRLIEPLLHDLGDIQLDKGGSAGLHALPHSIDDTDNHLCHRVGGDHGDQYGMRVVAVKDGVTAKLRHVCLKVIEVDASKTMLRGQSAAESQLYLEIRKGAEEDQSCFVVVRNWHYATNTVWKWAAEFTQRNPWVYILWEGTHVHHLLSENLDRMFVFGNAGITLDDSATIDVSYMGAGTPVALSQRPLPSSSSIPVWEAEAEEAIARYDFILLVGAPGVGKSHWTKQYLRLKSSTGYHTVELDGSNDKFTRESIVDVLKDRVKLDGTSIVHLDEWHMMNTTLKTQLLQWFFSHSRHGIKLILVCNRYDESDLALLRRFQDSDGDVTRHVVHCRGTVHKLLRKMVRPMLRSSERFWEQEVPTAGSTGLDSRQEWATRLGLVYVWVKCTAALFGPSLLSLRKFHKSCALLQRNVLISSDVENQLREFFTSQQQLQNQCFRDAFVRCILHLMRAYVKIDHPANPAKLFQATVDAMTVAIGRPRGASEDDAAGAAGGSGGGGGASATPAAAAAAGGSGSGSGGVGATARSASSAASSSTGSPAAAADAPLQAGEERGDEASTDLVVTLARYNERHAWFL